MARHEKMVRRLLKLLAAHEKLLILTHENPDPDAIASAATLAYIASAKVGMEAIIAYGGIIGRAENKSMVEVLNIPMVEFDSGLLSPGMVIAVVDTQPEAGNLPLPPEAVPSIVIDHHPMTPVLSQVPFADVRPHYGATSTILAEYILDLRLPIPSTLATAIYYGIKTDTQDLGRHTTDADRHVYMHLQRLVDREVLPKIEYPRLPKQYFETFRTAMERAFVFGDIIISNLDEMDNPNAVAEAADLLLRLEGMTWSLCSGFFGDYLFISLRTSDPDLNAGRVVQGVMRGIGSSGGHGVMAGGKAFVPSHDIEARLRAQRRIEYRLLAAIGVEEKTKEKLLSLRPRRYSAVPVTEIG